MSTERVHAEAAGYWRVVSLLLGAARQRTVARQERQQEIMRRRSRGAAFSWGPFTTFIMAVFAAVISAVAGYCLSSAVKTGGRMEAERDGKIVVSAEFKRSVEAEVLTKTPRTLHLQSTKRPSYDSNFPPFPDAPTPTPFYLDQAPNFTLSRRSDAGTAFTLGPRYSTEAREIVQRYGGNADAIEARLRAAIMHNGADDFVADDQVTAGLGAAHGPHTLAALLGFLVLFWWIAAMICQGEGVELDLQRRRHPMWEWLYSHPVPASAIFTAEMLSPLAANPMYWGAPAFVWFVYAKTYDALDGMIAAFAIGVPVAVALSCVGKALEIGIVIRFAPRSRGALLGLIGWFGYVSLVLLAIGATSMPKVATVAGQLLGSLSSVPWPWLGWFVGQRSDGSFSFLAGILACWAAASVSTALAVQFCVWGARQGISGNFGQASTVKPGRNPGEPRFGREPLYRKEFLWFIRDRSAIVQTILIPLSLAGLQLFNLRHAAEFAQSSWNYLSGVAIAFGTYFLWVLGPKSLASEGAALWLSLTWPRGLESLLKAKAWLWAMISNAVVALILAYAVFRYPGEWWKIALVSLGWLLFGRSMAEKTVTLVTVTSSSGDPEPIPRGRRWAAALGMLTFVSGVLTQQWSVAVAGIVYAHTTAAAMWENFRARLPFLYDPWSEEVPPPPTLMHAMIAVSILVEGGAVLSIPFLAFAGHGGFAVARSIGYAVCAVLVTLGMADFLDRRGVPKREVWYWRDGANSAQREEPWWCGDGSRRENFFVALMVGAAGGLVLALLAQGYLAALLHFPSSAEFIHQSREQLAKVPGLTMFYAIAAVGCAPFAEEYLFRGLLFRALDREWGGWRAVLGSAAFFAIYHPALSWLPVGLLGVANALLFKRTGRLAPAIALHLVYNAVILAFDVQAGG